MNEFENLISLLESPNKDNFSLGLIIAQNYRKEILAYFGCELEDLEELGDFLEKSNQWNNLESIFEINYLNFSYKKLTKIPKGIFILKNLQKLVLWHNQIQNIPKETGNLLNLKSLDLKNTYL